MKKHNGYTLVEMIVLLVIMGVAVVITINSTSYAFKDNTKDYQEQDKKIILRQAVVYGEASEELKTEETMIISVYDLIEKGYMQAEDDTFRDVNGNSLNDTKIKISYNKETEKVDAVILD